jgi:hypothetical protein
VKIDLISLEWNTVPERNSLSQKKRLWKVILLQPSLLSDPRLWHVNAIDAQRPDPFLMNLVQEFIVPDKIGVQSSEINQQVAFSMFAYVNPTRHMTSSGGRCAS